MKPRKEYLGDAVYAEADDYGGVELTTSDGIHTTNRIVLEPDVIEAFLWYVEKMKACQKAAKTEE